MQRDVKIKADEKKLIRLFKKGKTLREIGKEFGMSPTTVSHRLAELGYHKKAYVPATMKMEDKPLEDNVIEYIVKEPKKKEIKSIEDFTEEELEKMSEDEVRNLLPI